MTPLHMVVQRPGLLPLGYSGSSWKDVIVCVLKVGELSCLSSCEREGKRQCEGGKPDVLRPKSEIVCITSAQSPFTRTLPHGHVSNCKGV